MDNHGISPTFKLTIKKMTVHLDNFAIGQFYKWIIFQKNDRFLMGNFGKSKSAFASGNITRNGGVFDLSPLTLGCSLK